MKEISKKVDGVLGEKIGDAMGIGRWVGGVAVVTGASSGIGAAICDKLLKAKINVVGLARRVHLVRELSERNSSSSAMLFPLACDLRDEQKVVLAFEWIEKHLGGIFILVNNAGILTPTTLIDGDTEMWKRTVDVNFIGFALCTREAVKSMVKHNIDGHVVNVNSICGHFIPNTPAPCFNVYSSTKFAITALSTVLKRELDYKALKIKVSMISPGTVSTELNCNLTDDGDTRKILTGSPSLDPEDVAEACLYILGTPPHVAIQDLMIRVMGETI